MASRVIWPGVLCFVLGLGSMDWVERDVVDTARDLEVDVRLKWRENTVHNEVIPTMIQGT